MPEHLVARALVSLITSSERAIFQNTVMVSAWSAEHTVVVQSTSSVGTCFARCDLIRFHIQITIRRRHIDVGLANRFFVGADPRTDAPHSDGSVMGVGVITHGRHLFFVPGSLTQTRTAPQSGLRLVERHKVLM